MTTELDGATQLPPEGTQIATPGEFAARWNTQTDEQRQLWLDVWRGLADTASRCLFEDHKSAALAYEQGYADASARWEQAMNDA